MLDENEYSVAMEDIRIIMDDVRPSGAKHFFIGGDLSIVFETGKR